MSARTWTTEQEAEVVACIARGMSVSETAKHVGRTKNSVTGRLARLRRHEGVEVKRPEREPKRERGVRLPGNRIQEEPVTGPMTHDAPRGTCQWITGDPRTDEWTFCAAPTGDREESWCPEHRARVFLRGEEGDD